MTGNFTNWDGNITDIGPIYPFVGVGDADGHRSARRSGSAGTSSRSAWRTGTHDDEARMLRQGDNLHAPCRRSIRSSACSSRADLAMRTPAATPAFAFEARDAAAAADALRDHFLGWQCRIRQIAMRQDGGRPSPGMRPRVLTHDGPRAVAGADGADRAEGAGGEHRASSASRCRRSHDPRDIYERGLAFLQADYFQQPKTFSDRLTAVLPEGSPLAATLLAEATCVLEFDQFRQFYRLPCAVFELARRRSGARGDALAQSAVQSGAAGRCAGAGVPAGLGGGRGRAAPRIGGQRPPSPCRRLRKGEANPQNFRYAAFSSASGWFGEVWKRTSSSRASMSRSCWLSGSFIDARDAHPAVDVAVEDRRLAFLVAHVDVLQPVEVVPAHELHVVLQIGRELRVVRHEVHVVAVADVLADLLLARRVEARPRPSGTCRRRPGAVRSPL